VTLGGFIYLLPIVAVTCAIVKVVAKRPDTTFGRWRPAAVRQERR
jgi:hypothetical protein